MVRGMNGFGWLCALALSVGCLAGAGDAAALCEAAPEMATPIVLPAGAAPSAMGPTGADANGRVVAPVRINGQGPFRFIVDTGANRSVVSQGLADRLGLTPNGSGQVHSVHGVVTAPLVRVSSLNYGEVNVRGTELPLLQGAVLAGEQGLLGVDGMEGLRLRLDFERRCIEITPSGAAGRLRGWASIPGRLHFGHLVVVRGSISGLRVNLLLDTGSDSSLANVALRDALNAHVRHDHARFDRTIAYSASRPVFLDSAILIPALAMGPVEVRNVTAYVGDFHIFALWQMLQEPTLLIGMDVLSQSRGLAIDYGRQMVYMHVRDGPGLGTRLAN